MTENKTNQDKGKKEGSASNPEDGSLESEKSIEKSTLKAESMEDCMGKSLDQLAKAFMASARRWEMIVYPALFAFIILAAYGFFLVYSLTKDVHFVVEDMHKITASMEKVVVNMDRVSKNMVVMTQTVDSQSASMKEMVYHMRGMNMSMNRMRHDMTNISRPMNFMNDFLPW